MKKTIDQLWNKYKENACEATKNNYGGISSTGALIEVIKKENFYKILKQIKSSNETKTHLRISDFTVTHHPEVPNTLHINNIFILNKTGEGMSVDLDELWEEKF